MRRPSMRAMQGELRHPRLLPRACEPGGSTAIDKGRRITGMPKTNIQISTETRDQLTSEGNFGETYDKLIIRLLQELQKLRNGER